MIKRLKRRFIIVNMSILTCVLVGVLVTVFIMMYSSEVKMSNDLMDSLMSQMHFENDDGPPPMREFDGQSDMSGEPLADNGNCLDVLRLNNDMPDWNEFWNNYWNDFQNGNNGGNNFGQPWWNWGDPNMQPPNGESPKPPEESKPDNKPENKPDEPNDEDDKEDDEKPAETKPRSTQPNNVKPKPKVTTPNTTTPKATAPPLRQTTVKVQSTKAVTVNAAPVTRAVYTDAPYNENTEYSETTKKKKPEKTTVKTTLATSATTVTTTVKINQSAKNTPLIITDEKRDPPDDMWGKVEPDPFKGKVKRSYIYVEFKDVEQLEKIVYKYNDSTTAEDDDAVKQAAIEIFNDNDETGTITLGDEKFRYLFQYDPPKNMYSIILLDRTLEINTINRLLFIFLFIAGAGLILIFLISVLLANWTIKPVEKAWTQQKEFIANASHELKTPLTVISANTDVVLSSPDDTVKNQRKWLNYIKNETDRMSKLVNSLLYIAKYDANRIELVYSKIDLSDLLSSICLQYEPLVYEKAKNLFTDIDANIEINADMDKIKQVINILMDNALKYSLENGFIKVSLKSPKPSTVCMTISNNSLNIDEESIEKLFDRFYRVDDSRNRKTGGSGLGLNIAKTIVESHKGTIRAINKNNITAFIVTFNK